ncbi:MAG: osmotically inducible protein C [Sulfobacillus acidophilus]|uniref:Osmotically inducible protein C n=1 Tax=Sulfobacillus acidophilus TaxID=53633 RepID=A0A2T2WEB6_9FIRM|nr:MAG: osmotically inducible protein C [Sulfobacillus acidophilus]
MATMNFQVTTVGEGATGRHQTANAEFWSTETRLGGTPAQPTPLELLLGSLTGCMNVILQMVAGEKGWRHVSAKYSVKGELDPRGMMGDPGIPPYFRRIELKVWVSGVDREQLNWVRDEVDRRCPVHRLFEQAQISIDELWEITQS